MKKSDIINILKPQGFIKAVGRQVWVESDFPSRHTSKGMDRVTHYDYNIESYVISSGWNSITITQICTNDWDKNYLDKIYKTLQDNNIDCEKRIGVIEINK